MLTAETVANCDACVVLRFFSGWSVGKKQEKLSS